MHKENQWKPTLAFAYQVAPYLGKADTTRVTPPLLPEHVVIAICSLDFS